MYLKSTLYMEALRSSETSVTTTTLYAITTQKTTLESLPTEYWTMWDIDYCRTIANRNSSLPQKTLWRKTRKVGHPVSLARITLYKCTFVTTPGK